MKNFNKIYKRILRASKHTFIWDIITLLTLSPDLIDTFNYEKTTDK